MSHNRDIDHLPGARMLNDTLAERGETYPQVRVIESNGSLGPVTWSMIYCRHKCGELVAELSGPHVGNAPPAPGRREVSRTRVVLEEMAVRTVGGKP